MATFKKYKGLSKLEQKLLKYFLSRLNQAKIREIYFYVNNEMSKRHLFEETNQ